MEVLYETTREALGAGSLSEEQAMKIHDSLDRIMASREIAADLFYVVFLDHCPEVQHFFRDVDLRRQAVLLTMSLSVIQQAYTKSYPATQMYLRYLGTKHHDLGIGKELYPKFRDALLETLAQFHGVDWDEQLATQWGEAIDRAAELMFEGYEKHYTV